MQKAEVIKKVAKKAGLEQDTSKKAVEAFLETMKEALSEHQNVSFRQFGTFGVKYRAPKTARDIQKNTEIVISEHMKPYFKPSDKLKDIVDKRWRKKD
jgi:DNA-binding protein HU-beta